MTDAAWRRNLLTSLYLCWRGSYIFQYDKVLAIQLYRYLIFRNIYTFVTTTRMMRNTRALHIQCESEIVDVKKISYDIQHGILFPSWSRRQPQPRTLNYYVIQQKRMWIYLLSLIVTVILATPSIVRRIVIVSAFTIPITVKRSLEKIILTVARSPRSGILRTTTAAYKEHRKPKFWSLQLTPYEEYMNSRQQSEQQQQQQSLSPSTSVADSSNCGIRNGSTNVFQEGAIFNFIPQNDQRDNAAMASPSVANHNHNDPMYSNNKASSPSLQQNSPWNMETKDRKSVV